MKAILKATTLGFRMCSIKLLLWKKIGSSKDNVSGGGPFI